MEKYPVSKRNSLFANLLDDFWEPTIFSREWLAPTMKTDITEKDGKLLMEVDMPGLNKDDIKVTLKDGTLTISATQNESKEEKDEKGVVVRSERHSGSYSRSFYIGDNVKMEDITGSYENGVLKLEIPKEEIVEEEPKYVEIK